MLTYRFRCRGANAGHVAAREERDADRLRDPRRARIEWSIAIWDVYKRRMHIAVCAQRRVREPLLGCKSVGIHLALGELRQQHIELLLFLQASMQHLLLGAQLQLTGKSRSRAVCGDLVVLQLLRRCYEAGVPKVITLQQRQHLLRFLCQRLHRLVRMRLRIGAVLLQDGHQSIELHQGFSSMTGQGVFERRMGGRLRHALEAFRKLLLDAHELLQLRYEHLPKRGEFHADGPFAPSFTISTSPKRQSSADAWDLSAAPAVGWMKTLHSLRAARRDLVSGGVRAPKDRLFGRSPSSEV